MVCRLRAGWPSCDGPRRTGQRPSTTSYGTAQAVRLRCGHEPDPEQPVGEPVDFNGAQRPQRIEHRGRYAVLRPVNAADRRKPLYEVSHAPTGDPSIWTYLYTGPYPDQDAFTEALEQKRQQRSAVLHDQSGPATTDHSA